MCYGDMGSNPSSRNLNSDQVVEEQLDVQHDRDKQRQLGRFFEAYPEALQRTRSPMQAMWSSNLYLDLTIPYLETPMAISSQIGRSEFVPYRSSSLSDVSNC